MRKASELSRIPEPDFIDSAHLRWTNAVVFFLEREASYDLASDLATHTALLQCPPTPHSLGTPSGCLRPKYPPAFGGSLTRGPVIIFTPVLILVPVGRKKNVT